MENHRYSRGIHSDLDQALTENAQAKLRFDAMTEEERRRFRKKAEQARDMEEIRRLTDGLAGWQEGYPPYQL